MLTGRTFIGGHGLRGLGAVARAGAVVLGAVVLGAVALAAIALRATAAAAPAAAAPGADFPRWAYPTCPASPRTLDAGRVLSVPGSQLHFTAGDIQKWSVTADWFPQEHAVLPPILVASHSADTIACGYCHLPDGAGRPENAKLAGLPSSYIISQVQALRTGARRAAQPDWLPTQLMVRSTADLSDAEIAAAADYFSRQRVRSFVRLIERNVMPNHAPGCFVFLPTPGHGVPMGQRLVEMPDDIERFERRDPHTTYVAYVPTGTIERGRRLAATGGGGRTQPCASCHGVDLKGSASLPGPPLAGRFPAYLFRQLYGFQSGARGEDGAAAMSAVVARLTQRDMIDLAAYAGSLHPE